jgi:hypothetical protein
MEQYKDRIDWLIDRTISFTNAYKNFVFSKNRDYESVITRMIVWYYARKHILLSFKQLGEIFSKDHATALYGCKTFSNMYDTDRCFRVNVDAIEEDFCDKFPSKNKEYKPKHKISIQVFNSAFKSKEAIGKVLLGI